MAKAKDHLDKAEDWLKKGHAQDPKTANNFNELAYAECAKAIDAMGTSDADLLKYKDEIDKTDKASKTIPDLIAEIKAKMP
ncbi:hypothetical protein CA11_29380 [Gimesia maris]|uniref:hypothetical protein n=1 Tax=Gimesia maris TaxID=122 RepID=UPI00118B47A8|nr:hypothetical protein [Gimesia maris]QDU15118.1 hypothetical protein CA11_29380 [Gimesia maris]